MNNRMKKPDRFIRLAGAMILAALLLSFAASAEDSGERMQYGAFETAGSVIRYALYAPEEAADAMPLIVFLHGSHGRGDSIEQAVDHGFPRFLVRGELGSVPAWVLIPQLPAEADGWESFNDQVMALIASVCGEYHIDTAKISLTGHSMGGIGCWRLAIRNPDTFSCIVPISGKLSASEEELRVLAGIPTRAYIGDADISELFRRENIGNMEALTAGNPDFVFTVVDHADHSQVSKKVYTADPVSVTLDNGHTETLPEIVAWLISQKTK